MAELETRVTSLERQVSNVMTKLDMFISERNDRDNLMQENLDRKINNVMTKLDMFIEETRAAGEKRDADMRALSEKRDADMRALSEKRDADMRALSEKRDADMQAWQAEMSGMNKSFRTMNITVLVSIAALFVAILLK